MKTRLAFACAAATASVLMSSPASAATITIENITFAASDFYDFLASGDSIPTDPVNGNLTLTFDPTQTYTNETTGISLSSLNIPLGSPLSFSYVPGGDLSIGGSSQGSNIVQVGTDDFFLDSFSSGWSFGYTGSASPGAFFVPRALSVVTSGVPEPATWAMMLMGFGLIGGTMRFRSRRTCKSACA